MARLQQEKRGEVLVDAQSCIAGRLSSHVAKLLLEGRRVVVVNAEKTLISGERKSVLSQWLARLEIRSIANPKYGPLHPRTPDGILARIIRGMVPRRKPSGMEAFRRLRVYTGFPEKYRNLERVDFPDSVPRKPLAFYVPLADIASSRGWRQEEV